MTSPPFVKSGASLTAVTLMWAVAVDETSLSESVAVKVNWSVPLVLASGV